MAERHGEEDFRKQLGTKFHVRFATEDAPVIDLVLEEVKGMPTLSHARGDVERFSLEFQGPAEYLMQQSTYRLENEGMGELDIFLVPIGQDERGFRYEAVFNYFKND